VFIRRDTKKSGAKDKSNGRAKKGTTYLSIAHNVREETEEGSRTKPIVFANLGPEDEITGEMASSMVKAFERYAAKRLGEKPSKASVVRVAAETRALSPVVRILASKELGMRLLLSAPWQALGIGDALKAYEAKHRCEFPLERVVFAMVLNRLVDPKSKRACNEWTRDRAYLPEARGWGVQHFYRALDILHEHWEELEDLLATHLDALITDEERRRTLIDTTSMYFEAEMSDREIAILNEKWDDFETDGTRKAPRRPRPDQPNEAEFRMRGHNKDGHPECPQVKIALVCAPGGVIRRHRVYAGNVGDSTITKDLVERLPRPIAGTARVWVADAGMVGEDQIALLDGAGWDRVTAEALRKSAFGQQLFKAQGGQYRKDPERAHMSYKVEDVAAENSPSGRAERWVFTRNDRERERQLEAIERHLDKVSEELSRKPGKDMAHAKSVCAVASHVSYKKYVKPSEKVKGTFVFDQEAIAWERRLAGVRLYRTTLTDLDGPSILKMYGELQDVEAANKTMKHPLALRPCYHRAERRIRAHVMLTVLAANCAHYLERHAGLTLEKLRTLAAGVQAHDVEQASKRYTQRGEVSPRFEKALKALGMPLPPVVWSAWIELKPKAKKRKASAS
jgi:hypothetical protein